MPLPNGGNAVAERLAENPPRTGGIAAPEPTDLHAQMYGTPARGKTQQAPFVAAMNLRRSLATGSARGIERDRADDSQQAVGLCRHRLDRQSSRRNRLEGRMPHRERSSLRAHQAYPSCTESESEPHLCADPQP